MNKIANTNISRRELMKLYRQEKAAVEMPTEPFPSFSEWLLAYQKSNEGIFEQATEEKVNAVVETANVEIAKAKKAKKSTGAKKKTKKTEHVAQEPEVIPEVTVETAVTPEPAPVVEVKQEVAVPEVITPVTDGKIKKTDLAKKIYQEMMVEKTHPKRGDVIKRFMQECGLTQAGASTYQYNMKKLFS